MKVLLQYESIEGKGVRLSRSKNIISGGFFVEIKLSDSSWGLIYTIDGNNLFKNVLNRRSYWLDNLSRNRIRLMERKMEEKFHEMVKYLETTSFEITDKIVSKYVKQHMKFL